MSHLTVAPPEVSKIQQNFQISVSKIQQNKIIVPYETTAAKEFQRGMVTPQTQELELPHKNPPFTPDYK